jgi:hypothetical protein
MFYFYLKCVINALIVALLVLCNNIYAICRVIRGVEWRGEEKNFPPNDWRTRWAQFNEGAQSGPEWEFRLRKSSSRTLILGPIIWRQNHATWDATWDKWVFGPAPGIKPLGPIWWIWVILLAQILRVQAGPKGHFILGPIWSWAHLDLKWALTLALLYKVGCRVGLAI